MDAESWETTRGDLLPMVLSLAPLGRRKAGQRKLRLFAVGCSRLFWDAIPDERLKHAVELAEQVADGHVNRQVLTDVYADLRHLNAAGRFSEAEKWQWVVVQLAIATCCVKAHGAALHVMGFEPVSLPPEHQGVLPLRFDLLRCVFGNPFRRRRAFSKKWRTETVTALATGIYEERAFDRLPILADALEEAGCDDPAMLSHLRGPGPHCRGCWVLDLALGKV